MENTRKKRTNKPEVLKKASLKFSENNPNYKANITLCGSKAKDLKDKFINSKPSNQSITEFFEIILNNYLTLSR